MAAIDFVMYAKAINRIKAEEQLMLFEATSMPNMTERDRKNVYKHYKSLVKSTSTKVNTMDEVARFLTNGK